MFIPIHIENDDGMADRQRTPWLVYAVIILCTAIHAVLFIYVSEEARTDIFYRFGASRFQFRWWSLLTCAFLHGGWMHLISNMFFLWIYGRALERGIGSLAFAGVYLSGAFVSVGTHLLTVSPLLLDDPAIGASGAISAVLGAFLVLWPTARLRCLVFMFISFRPLMVQAPAFVVLGLWFVGQLIYTLKLVGDVGGVAFWAHVAGFAWGAVAAYAMQLRWQSRESACEEELRRPVLAAWEAWRDNRSDVLLEQAAAINRTGIEDNAGTRHLALAFAALAEGDEDAAGESLICGMREAGDYRREGGVLNHYLQMIKTFDPESLPWEMHREAGYAAVAMRKDELALYAFDRALAGGCSQGLDAVERAVRGACRRLGLEAEESATS